MLRAKQLVVPRKAKNQVLYSLRDPLLIEVLDIMRRYFLAHLEESLGMLKDMEASGKPRTRSRQRNAIAHAA